MKNTTYNESRVVALSLTLPEIDPHRFYAMSESMVEQGSDEVCWNASYRIYDMYYNAAYINVLDARLGYQVVRHFICECRMRYNRIGEDFRYTEVCQHWLCPNGEIVVMAKSRRLCNRSYGFDGNLWWFGSRMSIKHGDYGYIFSHISQDVDADKQLVFIDNIDAKGFYKLGRFILPQTERGDNYMHEPNQFEFVFGEIGEWLIKGGHIKLFDAIINHPSLKDNVRRRKPQIKIAYRNGYDIAERRLTDWFTYLDDLEADGRDIHNPHYICNDEMLNANVARRKGEERRRYEAERAAQRAQAEEERRRLEEYLAAHPNVHRDADTLFQTEWLIKRELEVHIKNQERLCHLPEWEEEYAKAKRAYLGIGFQSADGSITFHVLKSVEEFYEEAEAMIHCLFYNTCNYFKKKDCLILSARDTESNERLATIELNLKTLEVSQIRAKYDDRPQKYDEIKAALYNNMSIIKNAKKTREAV